MAAKRTVRQRLTDKFKQVKKKIVKKVGAPVSRKQRTANPFNARGAASTIREHNKEIDIRKYMK